ncbi:MAG TPA: M48 family metalloprotease [Terriglobales bacterium]|nr:M48 family metalloprotease [Terriglobales bacterium]
MRIKTRFVLGVLLLASAAWPQSDCPLPPAVEKATRATSIFSDEQEADLGDVMAERFAAEMVVVHNDALTGRLQQIGDQLVRYLPPTRFRFQFFLIEYPVANAFSIGGGRVYISRKIVALAKSDDELAGIMAHELGHIVTRQTGIEMTRRLREVLNITEVGDRNDIREKYFRYLDNEGRKPDRRVGDDDQDQLIADQVAVFAMARAGYSPHSYVDIWDRFQQTHGKTGSWLSDFFGNTKPSEKRLRDMMKSLSTLPAGCAEVHPPADPTGFAKWQSDVVNFKVSTLEESLPGLVTRLKLSTPLRPDISNLKFSPDGTHLLAQDEGGIQVLTRDPFAVLFFIDAPDAERAFFTPDSRSIIFYTSSLRVENWDVAGQRRISVHEMTLNRPCIQTLLSPDGVYLACLREDFSLALLEVSSGQVVAQKNNFVEVYDYWTFLMLALAQHGSFAKMAFSPDGRYFLAGSFRDDFAFDLQSKRPFSPSGKIPALLRHSFAFIGPDRIVGIDPNAPQKSPVLRFPSGERLAELQLSSAVHVGPVTHGNFVMVGPLTDRPLGVMDVDTSKIVAAFARNAGDVHDNWVVSERIDGRLSLLDLAQKKETATVLLSQSPLGSLTAARVSDGLNWLAVSSNTRGAIFDLTSNTRFRYTRSFHGAWFSPDDSLYTDFPKFEKDERKIVRIDLSPNGSFTPMQELKDTPASFHGPYLLVQKPKDGRSWERKDWTYEIQDYRTQKTVWTRHFPGEIPGIFLSPSNSIALLIWSLSSGAGHDELKRFPDLKEKAEKEDVLIELLDFGKDSIVGKLLVKTNKSSFVIEKISFDQDWLSLVLKGDRVLLYSLATGEQKGHFFGYDAQLSAAANALAISNTKGQLQLYDLSTAQLRREYRFSSAVAYGTFSRDGHRLFAFTRDQTAYILDVTAH